jgi:ATP-binding cassette, subfamily C (CFTR/MRP), member 4
LRQERLAKLKVIIEEHQLK